MQYEREERNLRGGMWWLAGSVLVAVVLVELGLLFVEPGAGLGLCAAGYAGIILAARREWRPVGLEWGLLGLLLLSALQSLRWIGFSNIAVMGVLLLWLSGQTADRGRGNGWTRWLDGGLTLLRPLGVMLSLREQTTVRKAGVPAPGRWYWVKVLVPALVLLVLFGWLLGAGNAVLGKWIQEGLATIEEWLGFIRIPEPGRVLAWVFFGMIALVVSCPAGPSRLAQALTGAWPRLGEDDPRLRRHQWLAVLLGMNVLFLFSSITDVVYLWFSRELPEGVTHSRYLHQGVYALILTTLLSALVMGLLTQHAGPVRRNRWLLGLAGLWMLQNLILISGVCIRLWIYVEAYGQTPRRVYVLLFLCLVLGGYLLLGHAVYRGRNLRWLVGSNLVLLLGYLFILQFLDVPGWVTDRNIELYRRGEVEYPESHYFRQIGSHRARALEAIYEYLEDPADRPMVLEDLSRARRSFEEIRNRPWASFQYRDYRNLRHWEEFIRRHEIQFPEPR